VSAGCHSRSASCEVTFAVRALIQAKGSRRHHLTLVTPEPRLAHGGAEFPGFGLLLACDGERALEIIFRLRCVRLRQFKGDLTGYAIDLGPRSLAVSIAVIASSMQRQASSNCPRSAWALAKDDKCHGTYNVAPVDRYAPRPKRGRAAVSKGAPTRCFRILQRVGPMTCATVRFFFDSRC
jgi:hypothetical protein